MIEIIVKIGIVLGTFLIGFLAGYAKCLWEKYKLK